MFGAYFTNAPLLWISFSENYDFDGTISHMIGPGWTWTRKKQQSSSLWETNL